MAFHMVDCKFVGFLHHRLGCAKEHELDTVHDVIVDVVFHGPGNGLHVHDAKRGGWMELLDPPPAHVASLERIPLLRYELP